MPRTQQGGETPTMYFQHVARYTSLGPSVKRMLYDSFKSQNQKTSTRSIRLVMNILVPLLG
jgi:hypothetical protein